MFEALFDASMKGFLIIAIFVALVISLAIKNPSASGGIARCILGLFFRR